MNYFDLEKILFRYTDSWTMPEGDYPLSNKEDLENAENILSQHYANVDSHHLDIKRRNINGTDYRIMFSEPLLNESSYDDMEFIPDKDPSNALVNTMMENLDLPVLNESSTSRIYKHLSDESTCAIISAFRSENDLKTNLKLFRELKNDVRDLGLGYVEFTSRWVEDGEASDEMSVLIPNIGFDDAYNLSEKYNQSSFIYKDGDSCKEYCTHAFENYRPSDVVRTFNNVGKNMLNLEDAKEIFARRKAGPASKAKHAAPFNLQVIEKFEGKPTTFRGPSKYVILSINESIEKHDSLNKDLFDENDELLPEVVDKIKEVVEKFDSNLKEDGIELDIKDIILVGSSASYNYTKDSDIDVHIIADTGVYKDKRDLALKLYDAYKRLFNSKYDPTIRGHEVEIYVDGDENHAKSNGIYSLSTGWVKVPDPDTIPEVDNNKIGKLVEPYVERAEDILANPTIEDIDNLIDDIYITRQQGILDGGEYSDGNLTFKEFRNMGYLDKLKEVKVELENDEMSLEESLNEDMSDLRAEILKDYLDVQDVDQIDENEFDADGATYLVVDENTAHDLAVQQIKGLFDDLGLDSVSKEFKDEIINNPEGLINFDSIDQIIEDEIDYYTNDEPDKNVVSYLKDLTNSGKLIHLEELYGQEGLENIIESNLNLDAIANLIIEWDGVANTLAYYDGDELDLGNGYYAYRLS